MRQILQSKYTKIRVCSTCLIAKPLTSEFFYRQNELPANEFQYRCKECQKQKDREKYQKNREYMKTKALNRYHRIQMSKPIKI